MELKLYTVVHPIGPDDFPWHPPGWRWAIHTDERFDQIEVGCLNAGAEATKEEAESMLSRVLITARRALTAAGVQSTVVSTTFNDCPLNGDILAELSRLG